MKKFLRAIVFLFLITSINQTAEAQTKIADNARLNEAHLNLSESDYKRIVEEIFPFFKFEHKNYPEFKVNILLYFGSAPLKFKEVFLRKIKKLGSFYILKKSELADRSLKLNYNYLDLDMKAPNLLFVWAKNREYCSSNGQQYKFVKKKGKWIGEIVNKSVGHCFPETVEEEPPKIKKKNP